MPVYNFNAGPAILPPAVLQRAQQEFRDYQGRGMSILEMSHRSPEYAAINSEAEVRFKRLLGLDNGYRVLFMQGGASSQFTFVPLNFLSADAVADYVLTGSWSVKAEKEARLIGRTNIAASTKAEQFARLPAQTELQLSDAAAYVHITTNNTIYGTQWHTIPDVGSRPLVADMSSDILSRPFDASQYALIYAGAQKNLGPAGVTLVLIREDWLAQANTALSTMFQYATYAANDSLYNTPPVFAVYMLNLVLEWLEELGGLSAIEDHNQRKAGLIYAAIDQSAGFYRGHAAPDNRSLMNITFRLPDQAQEKAFVAEAKAQGMIGLGGHRSVGGVRASVYNAMSIEGAETLAQFMRQWQARHG